MTKKKKKVFSGKLARDKKDRLKADSLFWIYVIGTVCVIVFILAFSYLVTTHNKEIIELTRGDQFLYITYEENDENVLKLKNLTQLRSLCKCTNCYSCGNEFVISDIEVER